MCIQTCPRHYVQPAAAIGHANLAPSNGAATHSMCPPPLAVAAPLPSPVTSAAAQRWANHVQDLAVFQRQWLADSSWKTARTAMLAYILICLHFGLEPVPAHGITDIALAGFILFLVQDKKAYSTIKTYLSMGPRVLQLLRLGTWTSISDRPLVHHTLCAARRVLGDASKPKLAITPDILRLIYDRLDFRDIECVVIYTAFLVAFWGFLRKSNVVIGRSSDFHSRLVLTRADISFDSDGRAWLRLRFTKTIQFQQRVLILPLALLTGDTTLCPSTWLTRMLKRLPIAPNTTPLFAVPSSKGAGLKPVTYGRFLDAIKRLLTLVGFDARNYAGQSFRRGALPSRSPPASPPSTSNSKATGIATPTSSTPPSPATPSSRRSSA